MGTVISKSGRENENEQLKMIYVSLTSVRQLHIPKHTQLYKDDHNCTYTNPDSLHRCGLSLGNRIKQLLNVLLNRHTNVSINISHNYNTETFLP